MPYTIKKQGEQWCVVKDSDGKVMGCHDTPAKAKDQLAAIYANEKSRPISGIERRSMDSMELRAEDKPPQLVGYAAKFDAWSEDLGGFREKIAPGAFDRALNEKHDVRLLVNHEGLPLARSTAGTLKLTIDEVGLRIEAELDPANPDVQRLTSALGRGDADQMSFGFRTLGDAWNLQADPPERTLTDVELLDVSAVSFPAYSQTEMALRSLEQAREVRSVPANVSTKLADRSETWSAPTLADFTGDPWGELTDGEKRRIAGHFAYAEEMPPATFGSLHLPHHRASDGAVVYRGVAAAAARLDQTSIPSGELAAVKAHLSGHYEAFDEVAPWNRSAPPVERLERQIRAIEREED